MPAAGIESVIPEVPHYETELPTFGGRISPPTPTSGAPPPLSPAHYQQLGQSNIRAAQERLEKSLPAPPALNKMPRAGHPGASRMGTMHPTGALNKIPLLIPNQLPMPCGPAGLIGNNPPRGGELKLRQAYRELLQRLIQQKVPRISTSCENSNFCYTSDLVFCSLPPPGPHHLLHPPPHPSHPRHSSTPPHTPPPPPRPIPPSHFFCT